ncbi:MAG: XkdN-like protein [Clostridia bacterium]|nr:XkdN-like protein [Clostridia bacterium]
MTLQEFLNKGKSVKGITKKIVIGDRFKDENGKDFSFTIKALSAEQLEQYRAKASSYDSNGNFKFESMLFNTKIAIAGCQYPNFKDAESITERGCRTPEEYIKDVLLPGEIEALGESIKRLSGYNISISELIEESKN